MSDKRIIETDGSKKRISVILTEHAMNRIERRFNVDDEEQIKKVLEVAATEGFAASDGGDLFIEYGCLLATCSHNSNGTLTVMTVLDLTDGISREMKERTKDARPTPWIECEVKMPGDEPKELNLPPSPGSSSFSKIESFGAFLPKNLGMEVNP